jgi:hypothetical protein
MHQKYIFIKFFRNVKHVLNSALIIDLGNVRCLTDEESGLECTFLCRKEAKCKQKIY